MHSLLNDMNSSETSSKTHAFCQQHTRAAKAKDREARRQAQNKLKNTIGVHSHANKVGQPIKVAHPITSNYIQLARPCGGAKTSKKPDSSYSTNAHAATATCVCMSRHVHANTVRWLPGKCILSAAHTQHNSIMFSSCAADVSGAHFGG